ESAELSGRLKSNASRCAGNNAGPVFHTCAFLMTGQRRFREICSFYNEFDRHARVYEGCLACLAGAD
ncbi:MAG TPA: hypothetical protein VJR71_04275, partial [Pseudolabrys sp.]|nr:hypothetical protein [Pseudolabrys sp.]